MKVFMSCILTVSILTRQTASAIHYEYVTKKMTLSDADKFCTESGAELSDLRNMTAVQQCPDIEGDLWTSSIIYATPYVSLVGCFEQTEETEFHDINVRSIIGCQYRCFNTSAFAIMDTKCACLENLSSLEEQVDPELCNIICEGTYCGGKNVINIYVTVEKEFFNGRVFMRNKTTFTSCVTTQCINKNLLYMETDCQTDKDIEVSCSTFFSCTFEPGDPCFLFQSQEDDFDWTITKNRTTHGPEKAYQGSFFAFVNDDRNSSQGKKATLRSNIIISAADKWCLRFRYYLRNVSINASLNVSARTMDGIIMFDTLFVLGMFEEWNYTELNIDLFKEENLYILFEFIRGEETSNFALDDITLTQGTCDSTLTKVLQMTGRLKCDFEGNQDICFKQDGGDNFDWTITRAGSTPTPDTGPSSNIEGNYFSYIQAADQNKGFKAVLISKFDLKDNNITMSLFYNMYGTDINTLEIYIEENKKNPIFTKTESQDTEWKNISIPTFIEGSQKLFISANVNGKNRGDIAIDDIQIKVNQPDYPHTWLNSSKECIRKVASYPIPHTQLASTQCSFFESKKKWTGIKRPHQKSTSADMKAKGRSPTWVQAYIVSEGALVWEPFSNTMIKSFVCAKKYNLSSEKDTCIMIRHETDPPLGGRTKNDRDIIIGIVVAVVVVIIFIVVVLIIFKRKLKMKTQHRMNNLTMTNITYERQNDVITVERTYSKNSQNSDESPDQEDYYVNQQPVQSGPVHHSTHSTQKTTEGDYDHLHATNDTKTSAKDDVYSHMTDDQYGFHKKPEDDTYDHSSFGLAVESEYGAAVVEDDGSNTYDHTSSINAASGAIYNSLDYGHGGDQDIYHTPIA